ncbi:M3 family metallopeptidase [Heyndrickxia acidicola]|uniref:M3 family metallopeptidase n=1 Tax=Heyndrickxia acidicola TaxID=209389 RepID=A0ABU6MD36_9BACI|nr:M3 family metallopeptidase [Heyndrickxia acidicola]MED1202585.1 M3 family metallopeptidase [Heyndrickxia acidicola]
MNSTKKPTRWNLERLYQEEGITSFINHLDFLSKRLDKLEKNNGHFDENGTEEQYTELNIIGDIEKAESYYYCLTTEEVDPSILTSINLTITALKLKMRSLLDLKIEMMKSKELHTASRLTIQALKGYEDIYNQVKNNLRVRVNYEGEERNLTFTNANYIAMTHSDQKTREKVFNALNNTLEAHSNIFSTIYNQMIGLRLNLNKAEGKNNYLDESFIFNGLSHNIIQTMWNAVDHYLPELNRYIEAKANEINKGVGISWYQLMSSSQEIAYKIDFFKAVDVLTAALGKIDSKMGEFVKNAVENGWVDAEKRSTKQIGGFCVPFIREGESRISLNYDETFNSARILAHELGHAWHYYQIKESPFAGFLEDRLEMTIAETASIFFESSFIDSIIQEIKIPLLKKALLGWKIERSLNYLMNIRGAYLFEKQVYELRLQGPINPSQLEGVSIKSQSTAYGEALTQYEPFVWIKYGQFFQTEVPFYNYPYSFGFLFSNGLLELSKKEGDRFSQSFSDFLSMTGSISAEKLVKEYFKIDLAEPEFWKQSVKRIVNDVDLYLKL